MTVANAAPGQNHRFRQEFVQLDMLTRHFFGRLFRNDIVDFEDQMKARLIAVFSILTIIVGWISELLLFKYNIAPDANLSWQEKCYVFNLMMIIFGIVTLLEWDLLFLDRQDFLNLTPLPVRLRTVFFAKLASFIIFIGLFSVAMNGMSSVLFSLYLGSWRSSSPVFLARYLIAHLLSAAAACFCVFFACVFIHLLLLAVLPFSAYRKISLLVRLLLIAVFVFFLLVFIIEPTILDNSFNSLAKAKDSGASFFFNFPPLWFVGLYEVLLGTKYPDYEALAKTAAIALALSLGTFMLASMLSYYRYVSKTLEAKKNRPNLFRLREKMATVFRNLIFWSPEERAVADFFSKTIRSSPKHRMVLVNYMGVAGGLILLFIAVDRQGFRTLSPENMNLLAQPLILSIVLLIGIRAVINIPAAPEARWVFQVTETARRTRYISGLKKAIFFKWFLPLSVLVFLSHLLLWTDWRSALNHAIFGLTISGLGLETAFCRFGKIPFACKTVPGRSRLQTRGVLYVLGLIAFLAIFSFLDKELLRNPSEFFIFFAFAGVYWFFLRFRNAQFLKTHPLRFEEEPEPALLTLSGEI